MIELNLKGGSCFSACMEDQANTVLSDCRNTTLIYYHHLN